MLDSSVRRAFTAWKSDG